MTRKHVLIGLANSSILVFFFSGHIEPESSNFDHTALEACLLIMYTIFLRKNVEKTVYNTWKHFQTWRFVCDANSTLCLVYMLATGTCGSEGVNLQVFSVYIDVNLKTEVLTNDST